MEEEKEEVGVWPEGLGCGVMRSKAQEEPGKESGAGLGQRLPLSGPRFLHLSSGRDIGSPEGQLADQRSP